MRCGFWPWTHSLEHPFSSQSFPSDNTAGVLLRTFIVKNISKSLTYTIASSCVCTSPLAVWLSYDCTISSRYPFQHHSSPFLLIICIDAPESTTNSRSSGLRVDAGRHLFSEGEKDVAPSCSCNFNTLLAASRHLALATLSPLETDPQILERWGCADEVHLGKYTRAKDFGLEF